MLVWNEESRCWYGVTRDRCWYGVMRDRCWYGMKRVDVGME